MDQGAIDGSIDQKAIKSDGWGVMEGAIDHEASDGSGSYRRIDRSESNQKRWIRSNGKSDWSGSKR